MNIGSDCSGLTKTFPFLAKVLKKWSRCFPIYNTVIANDESERRSKNQSRFFYLSCGNTGNTVEIATQEIISS